MAEPTAQPAKDTAPQAEQPVNPTAVASSAPAPASAAAQGEPITVAPEDETSRDTSSVDGSVLAALDDTRSVSGDSALGSEADAASYTASITSSITAYQHEHGRRYHAYQAGQYVLPNDEQEQERLDLQYHVLRLAMDDKPFLAPIGDNPKAILDAGTGTGIWAIDVADVYTGTDVLGTDLSPIQPQWIPPNVKFEVDDLEQTWTFPEHHFDLIHARLMNGSIRKWDGFFEQSFRHTKPGGYVECQEVDVMARSDDNSLPADSWINKWCAIQGEGIKKLGLDLRLKGKDYQAMMEAAGFVNVVINEFKIPIGTWPADPKLREIGAFQLVALLDGLHGLSIRLWTGQLGWSQEEVEVALAKIRSEWRSRKIHTYWPLIVVYGQKPVI